MGRIEHRPEAGDGRKRCPWAGSAPHMVAYHDEEWGVPLRDERGLFEFLILEGAQAGLSWATILARRDGYRRALHGFDVARIARYGARDEAMGACGGVLNLFMERFPFRPALVGGILKDECRAVLADFFRTLRS